MLNYILKRIVIICWTTFLLLIVCFFIGRMTPASVFSDTKDQGFVCTSLKYEEAKLDLDKPIPLQFILYLKKIIKNRSLFTRSYLNDRKTFFQELNTSKAMLYSFFLAIFVLIFGLSTSIVIGIYAAQYRYTRRYSFLYLLSAIICFMPPMSFARFLREIFFTGFSICDTSGVSPTNFIDFSHWFLPVVFGGSILITRLFCLLSDKFYEISNSDYIRTVRAYGISEVKVILYNSVIPAVVPCIGLLRPFLTRILSGSILIEREFSIPGVGERATVAASSRDHNFSISLSIYIFISIQIITMLVDIFVMYLNPRCKNKLIKGQLYN